MAARKSATKKTSTPKAKKKAPWYSKYSYTRGEWLYRLAWLVLLVFLFINYRGLVIAATVNGEPVSRLAVIQELEKRDGAQVLENLINEVLIRQKAKEANIVVIDEEINQRISEIETQLAEQGQTLDEILELQGLTRNELSSQIEIQILIERLLESQVEVTDEEINEYIETNGDFLPEELSEEELREEVRNQLTQQKLSQGYSTWIESIRNESEINFFAEY